MQEWRTDARAIRDCLGHNLFELKFNNTSLTEIHFKGTKPGFEFQETFTKHEFMTLLNHTDLLYRGSFHLLFVIISLILIKKHLL